MESSEFVHTGHSSIDKVYIFTKYYTLIEQLHSKNVPWMIQVNLVYITWMSERRFGAFFDCSKKWFCEMFLRCKTGTVFGSS